MLSDTQKLSEHIAGDGDLHLLPPSEYFAVNPRNETEDEDACTGCANPCAEHNEYPSYLNIEYDFPMLGYYKKYGRHVIIATGTSDWPKNIEEEEGTFAYSLYDAQSKSKLNPWKNMVSNSSLVSAYSTLPNSCDVMILPDNIIMSNVTPDRASDFYSLFLDAPLPTEPMDIDLVSRDDRLGEMRIHKNPYKTLLLLCSHKKRDKRCGVIAPILAQEFDHILREKDISEHEVGVIMVSHVGAHKIAGNVICYTNEGTRGIWYSKVKTCHCRPIVEETLINGKIIKDIYRGAMDKSFEKREKEPSLKW